MMAHFVRMAHFIRIAGLRCGNRWQQRAVWLCAWPEEVPGSCTEYSGRQAETCCVPCRQIGMQAGIKVRHQRTVRRLAPQLACGGLRMEVGWCAHESAGYATQSLALELRTSSNSVSDVCACVCAATHERSLLVSCVQTADFRVDHPNRLLKLRIPRILLRCYL